MSVPEGIWHDELNRMALTGGRLRFCDWSNQQLPATLSQLEGPTNQLSLIWAPLTIPLPAASHSRVHLGPTAGRMHRLQSAASHTLGLQGSLVPQPRALVSVWDVTLRGFEPPTFGTEGGGGTTRPIQSRCLPITIVISFEFKGRRRA